MKFFDGRIKITITTAKVKELRELVLDGLYIDGAHHKHDALLEIAKVLELPVDKMDL